MRDPELEGPQDGRALPIERSIVAEVLPQAQRDRRQLQPAAPAAAVLHSLVSVAVVFRHPLTLTLSPRGRGKPALTLVGRGKPALTLVGRGKAANGRAQQYARRSCPTRSCPPRAGARPCPSVQRDPGRASPRRFGRRAPS